MQLPLPGVSRKDTQEIVQVIPLEKDVDGLRWEESGIKPATVRGILSIVGRNCDGKDKICGAGVARGGGATTDSFFTRNGERSDRGRVSILRA